MSHHPDCPVGTQDPSTDASFPRIPTGGWIPLFWAALCVLAYPLFRELDVQPLARAFGARAWDVLCPLLCVLAYVPHLKNSA